MKKTGETIRAVFTIVGTAGLVDADSLPTGVLYLNGIADAAVVTVTKSATGKYRAVVTVPTVTDGDDLALLIDATVATVSAANVVWIGEGCTRRSADVYAATPTAQQIRDAAKLAPSEGDPAAGSLDAHLDAIPTTAPLTAQQIRDAAKLAPSEGDPAAGSLDAHLDAIPTTAAPTAAAVAAAIWAAATRTLTQSAAAVAAAVEGSTITVLRGDTVTIALTGLGDLTGRSKLWITGKTSKGHTDAQALFQVEETAGLLYVNGAVPTDSDLGSLTVDDAAAGDITIVLHGEATALLRVIQSGAYDVQVLEAAGPRTLTAGTLVVTADVTRVTS